MTKESKYELQLIDCNCNDCKFMQRDIPKYNHSKTLHHLWNRRYFDVLNKKKLDKAQKWLDKLEDEGVNEWEKALFLIEEVNNAKFMFNNDAHISFGDCTKFKKPVQFIANTCQLDTQDCFEHRKVNE